MRIAGIWGCHIPAIPALSVIFIVKFATFSHELAEVDFIA